MSWTHRKRMITAIRGGMPDQIPYAPRLDLWFAANRKRGTLPIPYRGFEHYDQVSRAEGWGIAKVVLDYQGYGEEAILDRALGVYQIPAQSFFTRLPQDVERRVKKEGDRILLEYVTPKGSVYAAFVYSEEMRRSGVTIPWISGHVLKGPQDYQPLAYIFENLVVEPVPELFHQWASPLGEDGYAVAYALTAGSPMHHIMKILTDSTDFYYQHRDHADQMKVLAEGIGVFYRRVLAAVAEGPGEIVLVGANFDDTITYPPFFRDHILPWLEEASQILHAKGKWMLCHTDGENKGLMDYLLVSGMDIADSVCPAPMTKVSLAEYYDRWGKGITIQGGIPSNLLLAEAATDEDFEDYLDYLFQAVAPGNRLILGVADTVPPDAVFDRLRRIAERVEKEGRLPLEAGGFRPVAAETVSDAPLAGKKEAGEDARFKALRLDLYEGLDEEIKGHIRELLDRKVNPQEILNRGLLAAMESIGQEFKNGRLFVPEVLLAARAMNAGLAMLEPHLSSSGRQARGKALIGTVQGDLHDIGKNMVIIMLRGVGFDVVDLGINVSADDFVGKVSKEKPHILGLSALLTTTMPQMKRVIEGLAKAGLRDKVRVLVGGAPVSPTFARQIGADGYASDAGEAVEVAKKLVAGC
jgi:corrinoid protein of di/trimethylamine methyltransferase